MVNAQRAPRPPGRSPLGSAVAWLLCALHSAAIWVGVGGLDGLRSPYPQARHDHPLYFHSAVVTRAFLRQTGTTAGYDPYFMAGYAKSVVFPASSTLPELFAFALGRRDPVRAYKLYVLLAAASMPWLAAAAARAWGAGGGGSAVAVLLYLVYVWTDAPIYYIGIGMIPYYAALPMGLLAGATVAGYLDRGGFGRWWLAATACALAVMAHLTTAMVVAPACAIMYFYSCLRMKIPRSRHVGTWAVPIYVLAANAFWWWPGVRLSATKGASDFAFVHPEPVWGRLGNALWSEFPAEPALLGFGLLGLAAVGRRRPIAAWGLGGMMAAGLGWGYLAGWSRSLDFLQPGRHSYALYSAAAIAGGLGLAEVFGRLRAGGGRLDVWLGLALLLVGARLAGPSLVYQVRTNLGWYAPPGARIRPSPFLDSAPTPRLLWVLDRVAKHVRPGERLLYEEAGVDNPNPLYGGPDPFDGGRYSGLLPYFTGVEVLGGPYLKASLTTNFTQFGGGRLFGREGWDRAHFVKYADIYRPSAILCWSAWSRRFCKSNPDLVDIVEDDGVLLIGRIRGYGGALARGEGVRVEASAGVLRVERPAGGVDGTVVLRYHSVPTLGGVPVTEVPLADDPVPFVALPAAGGPASLGLRPLR